MPKNSDFGEFFRRFENRVDLRSMHKDFNKLHMAIAGYAGNKWVDSSKQQLALAREANWRGFENITITSWVEKPKRRLNAKYRYEYRRKRHTVRTSGTVTSAGKQPRKLSFRSVKVLMIHNYVKKGYSANRIQKELKANDKGMRRKELLKIVREAKSKQLKTNSKKYTRKKYRK